MKIHQKLPPTVFKLCTLYDAFIVGGAVPFLLGESDIMPRDIDVVISLDHWINASKLLSGLEAKANTFGGFKFLENGIEVDVFAGNVALIVATYSKDILAYHFKTGVVLKKIS